MSGEITGKAHSLGEVFLPPTQGAFSRRNRRPVAFLAPRPLSCYNNVEPEAAARVKPARSTAQPRGGPRHDV